MGIATGFTVKTVRNTGMSSDYFGKCEVCGKHMSETLVFETHKLYKKADFYYLAAPSPGVYAHMDCQLHDGARIVKKETLKRIDGLTVYPVESIKYDLLAIGISPENIEKAMP